MPIDDLTALGQKMREARKKKEDCDNGTITPEDFSRWLKES